MKKIIKKAFMVGLKLFAIGVIVSIPIALVNAIIMAIFRAGSTLAGTMWVFAIGGTLFLLPMLILHILAYGWLVLKWKRWVFGK